MLETPQYDIVQMKKKGKWRLKIYFSSLWELRGKKVKKSEKSEKSESLRKKSRIFAYLVCFS
jgi:hypothetical protein